MVADLLRYKNRARTRVLMYHRFHGQPEDLQKRLTVQCEHLSRYYHPISMDDLAQASRENRTLPPNALAITVDDGYGDFDLAFPIFQKFGFRTTLYVVSGFAAGELWLWTDQLLSVKYSPPHNRDTGSGRRRRPRSDQSIRRI